MSSLRKCKVALPLPSCHSVQQCCMRADASNQPDNNRRESSGGMEWLAVWNRSLKFGKNHSFCGISGFLLEISASEKYFSDSGKMAIPYATNPYPH